MKTEAATQTRADEVAEKLVRIRAFLESNKVDGALFTGQANVSWATAGAEDVIIRGHDPGFVSALVTASAAYVLTQNIEGPRMAAEEGLDEIGFELRMYDWWAEGEEKLARELCSGGLVNDGGGPGESMADELLKLRLELTARERERMRVLASDTSSVMEQETASWTPATTERMLAARIVAGLEERAIFPSVLLIGGEERRRRFRHPTVSDAPIGRDVLTVIVGVRDGLHVAMSRTASHGAVDAKLGERHWVVCYVEAAEVAACRPGATWGEGLQAGIDAYAAHDHEGEWKHHYQGGPIGYAPRDFSPAPLSAANAWTNAPVLMHQAYAWNPTVRGAKSEDTFLVTADGSDWITRSTSDWPTIEVDSAEGPILRPAILEL